MTINRRNFIGTTTAGSLAIASGISAEPSTERKLRIGVIGVGWYGMVDAEAALNAGGVEVAAICDVDTAHLEKSAAKLETLQGSRPKTFKLYEEMLDQLELDAVIIGTPPQWHALQLMACIDRGLDVYCEKPVSYDIREGRAMVDAVEMSKCIVQVGFQRRNSGAYQKIREMIAAGELGRVVQADVCIHYELDELDPSPVEPPATLDWDLWCGPAPKIPYSKAVGHTNWRLERTTGNGHLVDWGIHNIDATRLMLGLDMPKRVTADGGIYQRQGEITTPDTLTAHFEFDELPVVWRHRLWGAREFDPQRTNGVFLYGEKASAFVNDTTITLISGDKKAEAETLRFRSDTALEHMENFLQCVRTRQQPSCPIADAFKSTTTVQLAMIAHEAAAVVEWDGEKELITNSPAAAALLKRDYREPWQHPWEQV